MSTPRRVVGIDLGSRRVGVAVSDATGTLARPLSTIRIARPELAAEAVGAILGALAAEEDGVAAIVVGLPRALDGAETEQTARACAFGEELRRLTDRPILFQDERLTSREAESRLARRERDWRKRKRTLDAAAAAVILQDYLDERNEGREAGGGQHGTSPVRTE